MSSAISGGSAPSHWTKGQYAARSDVEYRFGLATVADVLASRASWCLDCLAAHTRIRVADVIRQRSMLCRHSLLRVVAPGAHRLGRSIVDGSSAPL